MNSAAIAFGRILFACAVAIAIAMRPPAAPRLFASLARVRSGNVLDAAGWFGAVGTARLAASPSHAAGLVMASVLVAAIAFVAVEARARMRVDRSWSFLASLLAAGCCLDALVVGGGMANVAFAALALALVEAPTWRTTLLAGGLTALWCNVDAMGILAPSFAIVAALGTSLANVNAAAVRAAWIMAAFTMFATFATPLGTSYFAHALSAAHLAGTSSSFAWAPSDVAPQAYRVGFLAIVALALAVGMRGIGPRDAALAVTALVLALANGAFVPIFGIVVAPFVVGALAKALGRGPETPREPLAVLAIALAVIVVGSGLLATRTAVSPYASEPYASIERLALSGAPGSVYCANLAWCDAAEANGLRVLADGRLAERTPVERDVQLGIGELRKRWPATLREHDVGVAIVGRNSPFATLLIASKWHAFAYAGTTVILERGASR